MADDIYAFSGAAAARVVSATKRVERLNTNRRGQRNGALMSEPAQFDIVKLSSGGSGIYTGAIVTLSASDWAGASGFDDSTIGSPSTELVTVFNLQERNDGTFPNVSSLTAGTPRVHFFIAMRLPFLDATTTPPRPCYAINGFDLGNDSSD